MQSGFYTATGAMVAQFNKLDVVSNNLANLNTNSFKKDALVFGDYLRLTQESREMNNNINEINNHSKKGAKFLNRAINKTPHVVEEFTDFSSGALKVTDNSLDFALTKDNLFFSVLTPDGVKLTRDGSFSLDDKGNLVTKQGFYVLSNEFKNGLDPKDSIINVPNNTKLASDENGVLNAIDTKAQAIPIYRLFVGKVENINYVQKDADNLFRLDNLEDLQMVEGSGAVKQGFLETSNVNAVEEMMSLIETQRLVSMYQKVMKTHSDDLNNDAITKLARSKV